MKYMLMFYLDPAEFSARTDPEKKAAVYDEMVVQMNKLGWAATDLQIRPRIRA